MDIKTINERLDKILNESNSLELATIYKQYHFNQQNSWDPDRALSYLQFHYEYEYSTPLTLIPTEQIKPNGSYYIIKDGAGSLFVKGKHIAGPVDSLQIDNAVVLELPKLVKKSLTPKDKLASKLGFDYFISGAWETNEVNAKEKFMQYFDIQDIVYDIPRISSDTHVGRVWYQQDQQQFWMEFDNFRCTLEYFQRNIKPSTDETRARNTFARDQD